MKTVKKMAAALVLAVTALILSGVTAFAMEPVTAGFQIKNIDSESITVTVSSGETSEEIVVGAESSEMVTFTYTEPDTYEYTVSRNDAPADEPVYLVRIYVEVDENGALQAYVIPRIDGEKVKPGEVTFGSPDPDPVPVIAPPVGTGDASPIGAYLAAAAGAVVLIVTLGILFCRRDRRKDDEQE